MSRQQAAARETCLDSGLSIRLSLTQLELSSRVYVRTFPRRSMTADESRVDPPQESSRPDDRRASSPTGRDLRPSASPGLSPELLRPGWGRDAKPRPSPDSESAAEEVRPASQADASRRNGVRHSSLGGFSRDGIAYIGPGRWGGEPLPQRPAAPGARRTLPPDPGPDESTPPRQRAPPRGRGPATRDSSEGSVYATQREPTGTLRPSGDLGRSTAVGPSPGVPIRSPEPRGGPAYVPRYFRGTESTPVPSTDPTPDPLGLSDGLRPTLPGPVHSPRSIFGKWSPEILAKLNSVPSLRFETLRRELQGISPRMLSLKLRVLADQKLVERRVVDARPPKVQYSITDRGRTIVGLVDPVLSYLSEAGPAPRADVIPAGAAPSRYRGTSRQDPRRPVRRRAAN
jgi:DNA-binding HxlR family transcriptional regulator